MAIPKKTNAPVASGVNFGDLGFYSGSFTLPKGMYALEFHTKLHQPTKQDGSNVGNPRLGVMVNAHPINESGESTGDMMEQFFSMGSKAHLSFAPDAQGKGLVPVPGAPAGTAPRNTNWNFFLKSLYDAGLPKGIFENDITTIDGIWVQTDQVPEPEERKGYASQAATGEAAAEQGERRGSGMIPVVTEIVEGGKPWEGGGGLPTAEAAPVAKAAPKAAAKPVAKPAVKVSPAPEPEPAGADEDTATAAVNAVTSVLEANPDGLPKLKFRTETFKAATKAVGGEVAQAILDTFFGNDESLNSILGQLGYEVKGAHIKQQ